MAARLTVFRKAKCSPEDITALQEEKLIDPTKMDLIEKYAAVMINIIKKAPNGGLLPNNKSEVVAMYGLAQACPIQSMRESLMLEIDLMQIYTVLHNLEVEGQLPK